MKRALHRAHRQSRNLRNLVVVELALVSQRDDFAIFRPEPPDGRLQHRRELSIFSQSSRRRRLGVGELPPPFAILSRLLDRLGIERALPQLVDCHVMRNREEPGRKLALHVVGVQRPERLDERVLGQLLRSPRVADHPCDQPVDRALIAHDDLAERRLSPFERSTNQFDVAGRHALCFSTGNSGILLQKPTTNRAPHRQTGRATEGPSLAY